MAQKFTNRVLISVAYVCCLCESSLLAKCREIQSRRSMTFVGATLVCEDAKDEPSLQSEVTRWLAANGDNGLVSQIVASASPEEALFAGTGFRRIFGDDAGFERYIAAHRSSSERHLRETSPLLRRIRIGNDVNIAFRSGPEDGAGTLVYRSSWQDPVRRGERMIKSEFENVLWFDFDDRLKILFVFALQDGIPNCHSCRSLADRFRRLGLSNDVTVSVRTRRMPWFDDERFPRVFKFLPPNSKRGSTLSHPGIFIPSIAEYYLDAEVLCEVSAKTADRLCALYGRWSAENACKAGQ